MNNTYICYSCEKTIIGIPSAAMNIGFGVFEWCEKCMPIPKNVDDLIFQMDRVINPTKE